MAPTASITTAIAPVWFLFSRYENPGASRTDDRPRVFTVTGPARRDSDTPDFDRFADVFFDSALRFWNWRAMSQRRSVELNPHR